MRRHARSVQTPESCASARAWTAHRRNASTTRLAAACLSHGQGAWLPLQGEARTEPYVLSLDVETQLQREPRHFWGRCDADLRPNISMAVIRERPPRDAILHEWLPQGEGCLALFKHKNTLPDLSELACSFCEKHAGRNILFVGDSVHGEFFLAFAAILGIRRMQPNSGNLGCRRVAPRGSGPTEIDMSVELCSDGPRAVTARFIRNELLWLDTAANARARHADRRFGAPALMMCDWREAAEAADLLVLNRGYHAISSWNATREVHELKRTLRELSYLLGANRVLWKHVMYRGTHASHRGCFSRRDPEVEPFEELASLMRSRSNAQYNWRQIEAQGKLARALLSTVGVPYLDTYVATMFRPGGRMPGSCNHFCLPGPIDDWVRLLLAYWT
jgi:hypothetical protein